MKYDIFGIGNALMDFLIEIRDDEFVELDLNKGQFHMIKGEESKELLKKLEKHKIKLAPGGSSANTLYGVSLLGGSVVFCGKVGKDKHGDIYEEKIVKGKVKSNLARCDKDMTGHAITFITPDSERTFAVHLGASINLAKEDLFFDDIKDSKIIHVEGYQLEDKNLRDVSMHAIEFAKKNGVKISIDLGDPGVVSRNKKDVEEIIGRYADIVFANEEEAKAFTGKEGVEALNEIGKTADIVVVKIGKDGSLVKKGDDVYKIEGVKARAVDTTGAGDMYAAGFLYGLSKGYGMKVCGDLGSYFAARVVERVGARLDSIDDKEVERIVKG